MRAWLSLFVCRWTGGNNLGRFTGDAITTMYAVDATVCPDGLPHEPKFSQLTAMHDFDVPSDSSSLVNLTSGVTMFNALTVASTGAIQPSSPPYCLENFPVVVP